MENLLDLIKRRRTIRQFRQEEIPENVLLELADMGRLAPSAANMQPLEFLVVHEPEARKRVFPQLRWAAYINPAGNPQPGQEPTAYILILVNTKIRQNGYEYDVGAAAENIILGALTRGIGSCWLISVDRDRLKNVLEIPDDYKIDSVLALGYPAENPMVEDFQGSVKYWKDEAGVLHVPKRRLSEIVHLNRFGNRFPD
ncbi:MAG: nitroreductase family protein [Candidatus Saccharicenans sp.]|uniref:nitroreductase family protein n=1 Tax=Candidatus Saccharicenans sp. TaxID=2819258 RepID=UPI004049A331